VSVQAAAVPSTAPLRCVEVKPAVAAALDGARARRQVDADGENRDVVVLRALEAAGRRLEKMRADLLAGVAAVPRAVKVSVTVVMASSRSRCQVSMSPPV